MAPFRQFLVPSLLPRLTPTIRANMWTSGEDDLLAMGIRRFKTNWQEIQQEYFPFKTPEQVRRVPRMPRVNQ